MGNVTAFFRVAVSGATIDQREISAQDILDMATTYDPKVYGARIWLEHYRGITSDSAFNALGDVISLKAEDFELNGKTEKALYAQIKPTQELLAINKKSQKIYTSIEIRPNFAKTGKAYLEGLAVTDSPASLATEALQFCSNRKQDKDNIITAAIETSFDLKEDTLLEQLTSIFSKINKEEPKKDTKTAEQLGQNQASNEIFASAQLMLEFQNVVAKFATQNELLEQKIQKLENQLNDLAKPSTQQQNSSAQQHDGKTNQVFLTNC